MSILQKNNIMSNFNNEIVEKVSIFLQNYMKQNKIQQLSADDCASLLNKNNILPNDIGPKKGFNFRQMLRDGRDGLIEKVDGTYQEKPRSRWYIYLKK